MPLSDSNRTTRALPILAEATHSTKGLVRLTMACNERCVFCNVPMEDYPDRATSTDALEESVREFVASGSHTFTISGGEPTLLRKRLVWLVSAAREAGIRFVELQTNAVLIDPDYANELATAGLTSAFVSLLADRADLHDELAGLPGAFERCLSGIDALLDAGVRVTLNPVIASLTQSRVVAYIEFVGSRLPRVRAISLSAVQPHGRAARQLDLLPDYAVLGPEVRGAQVVARQLGIELLNPYCGLPPCVGWESALGRSVEAIEAHTMRDGGSAVPLGLRNHGNKRHGEPCRRCVLRPVCGGAWHAYWDQHRGSGLWPPTECFDPFGAAPASPHESVIDAERLDADVVARIQAANAPTVWLRLRHFDAADVPALLQSGATHLALVATSSALRSGSSLQLALQALQTSQRGDANTPFHGVWLGLAPKGDVRKMIAAAVAAARLDVTSVQLLVQPADLRERLERRIRALCPEVPLPPLRRPVATELVQPGVPDA